MQTPKRVDMDNLAPFGRRLGILDGIKVVDLTRFLAGPFASMILGDLGATVIKVEQLSGDSTRTNPPYSMNGDSAYFLSTNRNKQSIALDIKSDAGQEILRKLITEADILLDNLRAPQREALNLNFEKLKTINPRLVQCSITGFGSTGPYQDRPAYDIVVEALGGVMSLTGPIGGPSVKAGVPIGDITASFYALIGSLAGLQSRRTTGEGMHIDVAMLDCQLSLLSYLAQYYFIGGLVASHQGREHVSIPTYNTFTTADGSDIVMAANTQEMWRSLCGVLGLTELTSDPRFEIEPATVGAPRRTHRAAAEPDRHPRAAGALREAAGRGCSGRADQEDRRRARRRASLASADDRQGAASGGRRLPHCGESGEE